MLRKAQRWWISRRGEELALSVGLVKKCLVSKDSHFMKAITKKQFRVLLTASILLMLASVLAAALDSRLLPQPLLDYLQSQHGKRSKGGELLISLLSIPARASSEMIAAPLS